MSQNPSTGPSGQQWNLGKARPSSSRQASKPVEKPPAEKPPEPPRQPASEKVLDAILATEDNRPPIGRAVPESKGVRGALNHPLVLAGAGLVLVIALVYLVMRGSLAGLFGGRSGSYVAPPTAEERAQALRGSLQAQATTLEANGRLLMIGGQVLNAAGVFMVSPQGSQAGSEVENYQIVPGDLLRALAQGPPAQSPRYVEFKLAWDNQATASIEMGQQVIRLARENNIAAATVRGLGGRLQAEGLAILDDILEGDARRGGSGIDGARARLAAGTNLMERDQADPMLAQLLTDPLGSMILAARPESDTTPVRLSEETPKP